MKKIILLLVPFFISGLLFTFHAKTENFKTSVVKTAPSEINQNKTRLYTYLKNANKYLDEIKAKKLKPGKNGFLKLQEIAINAGYSGDLKKISKDIEADYKKEKGNPEIKELKARLQKSR